ncbi:hypothetical protein ABIB25_000570 [Nakamurella sp. UYEF19]|uniref:hypothetical protein n=1 Tax=Nakamurella sp. UYEF19 TaxID=1756392 RepID=UPI0033959251
MIDWLRAFAVTLLVELPIYALLLRRWCSTSRAAALGLLANVITHPLLWFGLVDLHAGTAARTVVLVAAEVAVWLVEWSVLVLGLRRTERGGADRRELAAITGLVNLASFGVGLLLLG